jgi:hypothetical protein
VGGDLTADPAIIGGSGTGAPADSDPARATDAGETALAPVGKGTVDDLAGPPGSFDELLNRRLRSRSEPWTRSIRLALAGLLPMALAAGISLRRSRGWHSTPL